MIDQVMDGAEPTFTPGPGVAGVLLLHDLGGTPQSMRSLSEVLAGGGFSVDVPLLPGHGTALDDLTDMTWDDWAGAAQLALDELASRTGPVVACGVGMGATLACWVAGLHSQVAGVIAINPRATPVPDEALEMLRAMIADGATMLSPLGPDVSDTRARLLAYPTLPVVTLISMFEALESMSDHWDEVVCPMLVITSDRDHRVSPANTDWLIERVAGPVEQIHLERSFHAATVDVEHQELEQAAIDFVRRVTAGGLAYDGGHV